MKLKFKSSYEKWMKKKLCQNQIVPSPLISRHRKKKKSSFLLTQKNINNLIKMNALRMSYRRLSMKIHTRIGSEVKMTSNAFSMSLFFPTSYAFSSSSSSFSAFWQSHTNTRQISLHSLFHTFNHFNRFCMSTFFAIFFFDIRRTFFNRLISVFFHYSPFPCQMTINANRSTQNEQFKQLKIGWRRNTIINRNHKFFIDYVAASISIEWTKVKCFDEISYELWIPVKTLKIIIIHINCVTQRSISLGE